MIMIKMIKSFFVSTDDEDANKKREEMRAESWSDIVNAVTVGDFQKIETLYLSYYRDFREYKGKETLLVYAVSKTVREKRLNVVRLLVSLGSDINEVCFFSGQTSLFYAVSKGDTEMVKLLIQLEIDIERVATICLEAGVRGTAYCLSKNLGTRVISSILEKEVQRLIGLHG